jgi:hypothetical protein
MSVTSIPAAEVAANVDSPVIDTAPEQMAPIVDQPQTSEPVSPVEPAAADESPHPNPLPEGEGTVPPASEINWHQAARDAVAQAINLPPAVRTHFTRSLDNLQPALLDAQGRPLIPVAEAVAALAAAMPANWLANPAVLQQASHPAGDAFFDASADGLSDERAAEIVRRQFESTGFLKAQAQPAAA